MRRTIVITSFSALAAIASCSNETTLPTNPGADFIVLDTANKMINSYLNSINYQNNDTDLRSLIFNADEMRDYLADTNIKNFKVMLAHTQEYINSGNGNQNAKYESGALTFIISGINSNGDYIYNPSNKVLNRARPCPTNCPPGNASSPTFPQMSSSK